MSLVRFKAQNHPQQAANPEVDDRMTAPEVFDPLNEKYHFTIDVAASPDNKKRPRYYDKDQDGLTKSWAEESVWCNPPYSNITPWVAKAWLEQANARIIVMLVPANRTEQGWWQDYVEPYRDRPGSGLTVEFIRGRLRFIHKGQTEVLPNQRPPFGCCLLIWSKP